MSQIREAVSSIMGMSSPGSPVYGHECGVVKSLDTEFHENGFMFRCLRKHVHNFIRHTVRPSGYNRAYHVIADKSLLKVSSQGVG